MPKLHRPLALAALCIAAAGLSPVSAATLVADRGRAELFPSGLLPRASGVELDRFETEGSRTSADPGIGGPGARAASNVAVSAVPEVGSWAVMLLSVGVLGGVIRARAGRRVDGRSRRLSATLS